MKNILTIIVLSLLIFLSLTGFTPKDIKESFMANEQITNIIKK